MESIGTLAGGVAHQYNNILAAMQGNFELLQMDFPDKDHVEQYLKNIESSIQRMALLSHQLLAYARGGKYHPRAVPIGDFILETVNLLGDGQYERNRKRLVSRLRYLQGSIHEVEHFAPVQRELSRIVNQIRPIESSYASRIYDCNREIQKTLGANAAWAGISTLTMGLLKKSAK